LSLFLLSILSGAKGNGSAAEEYFDFCFFCFFGCFAGPLVACRACRAAVADRLDKLKQSLLSQSGRGLCVLAALIGCAVWFIHKPSGSAQVSFFQLVVATHPQSLSFMSFSVLLRCLIGTDDASAASPVRTSGSTAGPPPKGWKVVQFPLGSQPIATKIKLLG
jgi:hypothetical protein